MLLTSVSITLMDIKITCNQIGCKEKKTDTPTIRDTSKYLKVAESLGFTSNRLHIPCRMA